MKNRTPWGQIFPQLNFANCIEKRISFFPLKHRVFYFSDSPHSEPGTIDEVDHDNGTEPHTSDDGKHRQQQQSWVRVRRTMHAGKHRALNGIKLDWRLSALVGDDACGLGYAHQHSLQVFVTGCAWTFPAV